MSFHQLNLDPRCVRVLDAQGITVPTPIQAQAIPAALEGRDLVAIAQTGTGKTLAFGLPSLTRLRSSSHPRKVRMLVLTPTRELAVQVHTVLEAFGKNLGLRSACVYGGVGMNPQTAALRGGADIIVATPGRLIDHIDRGNARFDQLSILVLDEADRMLDMGFFPAIKRVVQLLPKNRQTLMFSATFPKEIERLARELQHDPVRVQVGEIAKPADAVKQSIYRVDNGQKQELLNRLLRDPQVGSTLVFLRTKHRTDRVAQVLNRDGFKAKAIHGGRSQAQRQHAIDGFRKGHYRVLVATDVAARGIDVEGITHVINYDIPRDADDYVHRIGRTARASATGTAITFVSGEDNGALKDIEKKIGKRLESDSTVDVATIKPTAQQNKPQNKPQGQKPQGHGFAKKKKRFRGARDNNDWQFRYQR